MPERRGDPDALEAMVTAMADRVAHRGPDASGSWLDADLGLALGHRRLAVVGLGETGAQPMLSRSQRWVLTYNGELYGAGEVRSALESAGTRFRGTSDTEVLVEAIDRWGVLGALAKVDGMFAFAAWDREQQKLFLVRDRMGEKPLAYSAVDGGFAFGSELSALRVLPGFDSSISPEAVALFLRFKYVPTPFTIHPTAKKLPAGHLVEVDRSGRPGEPEPYWSLADELERRQGDRDATDPDDPRLLDQLDEVIGAAVGRSLRSDVSLGAFLSGGIDSSLVATLAAERLDRPLQTFTIGSPDADHDESAQARTIAQRIGADHTELTVTPEMAIGEVPDLAGRWDEPFGDSSQLPMLLVSRLARGSVTVALSGDGGDELFGGYNRHLWLPRTWRRVGRLPHPARAATARVLAWPQPSSWDRLARLLPERRRPRLVGLKAQKFAQTLGSIDQADAYRGLVSHWQDPVSLVPGVTEPETIVDRTRSWPRASTFTEQMMAVDALTYLPDDVLVKVDRAAMSVALESRVPLLSRAVVEMSLGLPLEMKVRGGEGKWALRELLARRHPRELFERPKSGFGVPIATWLRGELRPWAEDLLAGPAASDAVDLAAVRSAWLDHQSGRADRSYELWDVLMLQSWARSAA